MMKACYSHCMEEIGFLVVDVKYQNLEDIYQEWHSGNWACYCSGFHNHHALYKLIEIGKENSNMNCDALLYNLYGAVRNFPS